MLLFHDPYGFFTKVFVLLAIALCCGCSSEEKEVSAPSSEGFDLSSLLSIRVSGWQEIETMLASKPEDIYEYMDGGAELYFAYGLKSLAIKKFKNKRALPMLVEVYEFDNSENAYGIYSFDTVGDKLDIGQDAVCGHGLLRFWKDKIFVRVFAEEEHLELAEDILIFGRQIDSRILNTGLKPDLLSLIPDEDLVPDSLHFFHQNICLNNIHYIPESTALKLSEQTDAVTAQYKLGENRPARLLLIEYPSESAAGQAFESFSASYFQGESIKADLRINTARMAENEYNAITLNRNFVILVFEAQYADRCKKLVAATLVKIELYGRGRVD
jgi:hypothetical protein